MEAMKVPFRYQPLDRPPRETELQQLRHRHHAVLSARQPASDVELGVRYALPDRTSERATNT